MKLVVLGAGAWGTALSISFSAHHDVRLWARDPVHCEEMNSSRINRRHLDGFLLTNSISIESNLSRALEDADLALIAVPMSGLRDTLKLVSKSAPALPLIWTCKGFEAGSSKLPHEVAREEYRGPCGALSGPSFAEEVAKGLPVAVTIASQDPDFASNIAAKLHSSRLRIYSSGDIIGVEVGGAVKNVMAIASGISDGLGLGFNARASLITRGLAEITRLGLKLGGRMETFLGLSGVGDLILTCTGDLSRNRKVGMLLAKGEKLPEILHELNATAEGVYTAREVSNLAAKLSVEMPITNAICKVLYEGVPARLAVEELMKRDPRPESELHA